MHFNPRSLTGATFKRLATGGELTISIHAPSQERQHVLQHIAAAQNFNPRSLAGATLILASQAAYIRPFQSTLPHRSDFVRSKNDPLLLIFQSTLPHRSDGALSASASRHAIFQSTLPHGSDIDGTAGGYKRAIFQSTLPHGSDGTAFSRVR